MVFDITTHGNTGFTGSETSACSGKLSSGMRTPAIAMTTLVWPAATTPTLLVADWPPGGLDPCDRARRIAADRGHLAVLDDVDAELVGGARIAPGDRIVARDAAAALQGGADDRVAHARPRY